jgi:hypothetical protein
MRWSKGLLRKELGRLGLWLKGFEVRGGRLADALQEDWVASLDSHRPAWA